MSGCFSFASINCNRHPQNNTSDDASRPNFVQSERRLMMTMTPASGDQHQKKEENDRLLSQALSNLTFEERQKQQESVHGVVENVQEDEAFLENCLNELDQHLVPIKKGSVYETAEMMNPSYVRARKFRVMFLRGNRYDTKAAAEQMLRFFQVKQRLFGINKLTKDITIEDLDEDDLASLKSGFIQILGRDRSNREILLNAPGLRSFQKIENELRSAFYIQMTTLQSEETQVFGTVVLANNIDECKDTKRGQGWFENAELSKALPVHLAAIHFLCDHIADYVMANVALKVFNPDLRARFQMHLGSQLECQYILSPYGIGAEVLPLVQGTSAMNLQRHLWSLNARSEKEVGGVPTDDAHQPEVISDPIPQDVVYIRAQTSKHLGTQYLRMLVKENSQTYNSGNNKQKRRLVDSMIAKISESGGRFLEEKDGGSGWQKVPMEEVRSKIMQSFRNHRQRMERLKPKPLDTIQLIVGEPLPDDVVFGRGPRSQGSELLMFLIKERWEEYEAKDRGLKLLVVDGVIEKIKESGGRFLQPLPQNGAWMEVSHEEARSRVSKYFRNMRRSLKTKPK